MNNIYLVGFMGTGKSRVGKLLSERTGRRFIDLDNLIEEKENRRISDIFAKEGEVYFRRVEKDFLADMSKEDNLIIACGGGIVIDADNIKLMKQTGSIICLTARPEVILERIKNSFHRPLLNVSDPRQKIEELLESRAAFYALSDKTIDTSELSMEGVADKISELIL